MIQRTSSTYGDMLRSVSKLISLDLILQLHFSIISLYYESYKCDLLNKTDCWVQVSLDVAIFWLDEGVFKFNIIVCED